MPSPRKMERRYATELRAIGRELIGHAAVFDQPARIENRFTETVRRGSFRATLAAGDDVAMLVDHDGSKLLGRTASGTLQLREDAHGLAFTCQLPATQLAEDVLELTRRGDIRACSFGFTVPPGGDRWPAPDRRELLNVQLAECSIIHFRAAYAGTSVAARGLSVRAARLRLALI
jgi:HK97 family phage prohead protease